jgi:hypothetical protein
MLTLTDIQSKLEERFAIEDIDLLPKGKTERDGKIFCMALPYADKRVYEDRLNQLAPGEWSTPPPLALVVGQKLVVYVSVIICGVVHTDVGEAATISENGKSSENAATESYAQAFKRACSQFGLGRYLYDLEKAWVPFNPQKKQIDLKPVEIQAVVRRMYSAAGIGERSAEENTPPQARQEPGRITPGQYSSIKNLCKLLGREVADGTDQVSEDLAKQTIATLAKQWQQKQHEDKMKAVAQAS